MHSIDAGSCDRAQHPLILIHGARHSARCWDEHFLPFFGERGYQCIALEFSRTGPHLRIDDYVAEIKMVAATFTNPPVLIGHTEGGYLVQQYLARHAASGAVLMASAPTEAQLADKLTESTLRRQMFRDTTPAALIERCYRDGDDSLLWSLVTDDADTDAHHRPPFRLVEPDERPTPVLVIDATEKSWGSATARRLGVEHRTGVEYIPGSPHDLLHGPQGSAVADRVHGWVREMRSSTRHESARDPRPPGVHILDWIGAASPTEGRHMATQDVVAQPEIIPARGVPFAREHGVVRVLAIGQPRHGVCSCGWVGRRRRLRGFAVYDALSHATETGCTPASPLVLQ